MKEQIRFYKNPVTEEIREIPRNENGGIKGGFRNDLDAIKWMKQWDLATAYLRGDKNVRYNAITNLFELKH